MTTSSWSFSPDHNSDAGYRAWVQDFIDHCVAVGLTQTADTGQFSNTSETKPAANTVTHYAIFQMAADAVNATAPIYIKFVFGTSTSSTRIRIDMHVGTGTNGSGTITGTATTGQVRCDSAGGGFTGVSSYTHYMCYVDGAFWWVQAANSVNSNNGATAGGVFRSTDTSGVPDVTGAVCIFDNNGQTNAKSLRFAATAAAYTTLTTNPIFGNIMNPESSTLVGGVPQVFPCFGYHPQVFPCFAAGIVKNAEIAEVATFTWTPFGSTSHTYINMNTQFGSRPFLLFGTGTTTIYGLALIWE